MANFKAVVRGVRKDGFMQVYIRVTHRRAHGYIKTDKMVTKKELTKTGEIRDPFVMNWCSERILEFNERLNRKDIEKWSEAEVVEFLKTGDDDVCFSEYARRHIDRMIDRGQERNARNYKLALQHMERFYGTNRIMFGMLRSTQVNEWLDRGLKEYYPVVFVDGVHIKIHRIRSVASEALYEALAVTEEGTREVLDIFNMPQESATGWRGRSSIS